MSNWQNALDSAIEAGARGFSVFPLSRNKVPAIPSPHDQGHSCSGLRQCGAFGHGVGDASNDADTIRAAFDQARHAAGYGIACGAGPVPLVGVDLDRKNDVDGVATLNQLADQHRFTVPQTVTVCTPSGGFHLWFTGPSGTHVPNSVGRLGPGIDIRGTRGYLVGPGSRGKTGTYTIHPRLAEPTVYPIPQQLLGLLAPPPPPAFRQPLRHTARPDHASRVLDGLVRVVAGAEQGTRNDRLFWAAAKAWAHVKDGHLAAGDVEAALITAAVGVGLGDRAAKATVASARKGAGV
ncbi:bifunctional DNA primase/polymerase [Streptomyces sp. NPDC098789]|uniref:bifunctional DNA primase/polymerase n=1 Tax=Streptomyces sp. NPDC098789 TaxID=3366098 RepID=UPI003827689E